MAIRLITVDAFSSAPFAGNPAAVCMLDGSADESWMQIVAREMNLSETAFLVPLEGANRYGLRWFTPRAEVALCGHATIASAHAIWSEGHAPADAVLRFETLSGELAAVQTAGGWIELDFPALEPLAAAPPMELTVALGAEPVYTARSRHDILVELATEETVRNLKPDLRSLAGIEGVRGVIVTAEPIDPDCGYDFVSRFFAPSVGVDEDPVTGSAHCVLGPYWSLRLGKGDLTGFQASLRSGIVKVGVRGDRVKLRGQAVTIVRGEIVGGL